MSAAPVDHLMSTRSRVEPGGALAAVGLTVVAAGVGAWIGWDLRGRPPLEIVEALYNLALVAVAPLPLLAVDALYHEPLHAALLPWPVSGAAHLSLGIRRLRARVAPWIAFVAGVAIVAGSRQPVAVHGPLVAFAVGTALGGVLFSVAAAGLCAAFADADHAAVARLRKDLSRGFSPSDRHAPFFYLPAFAFAATAVAGALAEPAVRTAVTGAQLSIASVAVLLIPVLAGIGAAAAGAAAYRRHALRVIPRVVEEARSIYGGEPAPTDPPYGLFVARALPRAIAPHFRKELREQARVHRGLWAIVVLAVIASGIFAVNIGDPSPAAPLVGLVLAVWVATLPTRRAPRDMGAAMLRTLPHRPSASVAGRWLALTFAAAHIAIAVSLGLWSRGRAFEAVAIVTVTVAGSAVAALSTRPSAARGAFRWTPLARVTPALTLVVGIAATVGLSSLGGCR